MLSASEPRVHTHAVRGQRGIGISKHFNITYSLSSMGIEERCKDPKCKINRETSNNDLLAFCLKIRANVD